MGHGGKRKHGNLHRSLDVLDAKIRDGTLANPTASSELFERQVVLNQAHGSLGAEERIQIRLIYQLLRRGYKWPEVVAMLAKPDPGRVKHRFSSWPNKTDER